MWSGSKNTLLLSVDGHDMIGFCRRFERLSNMTINRGSYNIKCNPRSWEGTVRFYPLMAVILHPLPPYLYSSVTATSLKTLPDGDVLVRFPELCTVLYPIPGASSINDPPYRRTNLLQGFSFTPRHSQPRASRVWKPKGTRYFWKEVS